MSSAAQPSTGQFLPTRWSLVVAAQERDGPRSAGALAELCHAYWYPLYAFVRRQGHGPEEAQDLTQEFFARLLEKDYLAAVDPAKGRFRSFLLVACKHFLANECDRANAQKRGGRVSFHSLQWHDAEERYAQEPAHELTPEKLFERRWALALLDQVLNRLHGEYVQAKKGPLFDRLKEALVGGRDAAGYSQAGADLGLSEGAIKVAVHRLRKRYRELLLEEIGRTVDDAAQIDEEIRDLFAALGA
jgi:RNA polymerase sigma-70 factor (ECF subfamily)